jgi:hypothetical protein
MKSTHDRHHARPAASALRPLLALAVVCMSSTALAKEARDMQARWNDDFTELRFAFRGRNVQLPDVMAEKGFPGVGAPQQLDIKKKWPVVTMQARWSASAKDWPAKYRENALDFIMMRTCDVRLYQKAYPKVVLSTTVKYPPEFVKKAQTQNEPLTRAMRGKSIGYQLIAKGGFGADDPVIDTKIIAGLSKDEKTFFYHDKPHHISDNLVNRESIISVRDAGDRFYFQVNTLYVCADRRLFRDVALSRVSESTAYPVKRMFDALCKAPSEEEIKRYYEIVAETRLPIEAVAGEESQAKSEAALLVNTKWRILERRKPDGTPDQDFKERVVSFMPEGKIVTKTTLKDGTQEVVEEDFKWDVSDGAITLTGTEKTPEGEKEFRVVAMYTFEGEKLRVVSDRFIILAEPYQGP